MCAVFGVSPSGYYEWSKRADQPSRSDAELLMEMRALFIESRMTFGSRRMVQGLKRKGRSVGRCRVRRLMREDFMVTKHAQRHRRVVTTDARHSESIAPNLLSRNFNPITPNVAWSCDITYLRTRTGFVYLAIVMDLFSRRIIGWAVSDAITQQLTIDALYRAWISRKCPKDVLIHSDRGSQYAAVAYRGLIKDRMSCIQSMSRKGNCWDNAPVESFFSTLKIEAIDDAVFADLDSAQHGVWRYIEPWYNQRRLHSSNQYLSPIEKEQMFYQAERVA
jgi:transposase InsO family protein